MKKIILLFLPLLFPRLLFAQTEPANYAKVVKQFTEQFNKGDANAIFSMLSARAQVESPLETTKQFVGQFKSQFGDIVTAEFKSYNTQAVIVYKTTFAKNKDVYALRIVLDAENKINDISFLSYIKEKFLNVDLSSTETSVSLSVPDANLSSSLLMPKNSEGKIPVVLIIAGSGATDRDGNNKDFITSNPYFLFAQALGKAGIATLRYDNRSTGKSSTLKSEADLRFDYHVNDAIALVKMLKNDQRFSKVIILGHTQGSLMGILAAEKEKVNAFISIVGAGEKGSTSIRKMFLKETPQVKQMYVAELDSLDKGLLVAGKSNNPIFPPEKQSFMISWFKYNPQVEIAKLKIPVLLVEGTTDFQFNIGDVRKLKKAKPDASLVLIDGMNYVLRHAPEYTEKNAATINNPNLPIDPKLVDAVVQFIGSLK